jgi:hypothetical protein
VLTGSFLSVCFLALGALFAANIIAVGCFVPICCVVIFMRQLGRCLQQCRGRACRALLVPCCQLVFVVRLWAVRAETEILQARGAQLVLFSGSLVCPCCSAHAVTPPLSGRAFRGVQAVFAPSLSGSAFRWSPEHCPARLCNTGSQAQCFVSNVSQSCSHRCAVLCVPGDGPGVCFQPCSFHAANSCCVRR